MKIRIIAYSISFIPLLLFGQVPPPLPPVLPHMLPYDTATLQRYQLTFDSLAKAEVRMVEDVIRMIETPGIHNALKIELIMLLGSIDNEIAVKHLIENITKSVWNGPVQTPYSGNQGPTYKSALMYKKTLFALPFLYEFARSKCLDKSERRYLTDIFVYYISGSLNLDPQWILYTAKGNRGDRDNPCVTKNFQMVISILNSYDAFSD